MRPANFFGENFEAGICGVSERERRRIIATPSRRRFARGAPRRDGGTEGRRDGGTEGRRDGGTERWRDGDELGDGFEFSPSGVRRCSSVVKSCSYSPARPALPLLGTRNMSLRIAAFGIFVSSLVTAASAAEPAAKSAGPAASIDGFRFEFPCKDPMPENPMEGASGPSGLVKGDPKTTDNFTAVKTFGGEKGKRYQ